MQENAETEGAQIDIFLNSVPILQKLSPEERSRLGDALEEKVYRKEEKVVQQVQRYIPASAFFCLSCSIWLQRGRIASRLPSGSEACLATFDSKERGHRALSASAAIMVPSELHFSFTLSHAV